MGAIPAEKHIYILSPVTSEAQPDWALDGNHQRGIYERIDCGRL